MQMRRQSRQTSTQIAIGGVFSALCVVLMFMTGVIPFTTYAMPAAAGLMLVAVVLENGRKTAALVYISVSLLSAFIVPDRQAALVFIAFLGYYPIVKGLIVRLRVKVLVFACSMLLFNIAVVSAYAVAIYIIGIPDILDDLGVFGQYGRWGVVFFWVMHNVAFVIYDYLLTRYEAIYLGWFRPKFLRR